AALTAQAAPEPNLMSVSPGATVFDQDARQAIFTAPGSDAMTINNNMGGATDEFYKRADSLAAEDQMSLVTAGREAQRSNALLGQLSEHLTRAPQGGEGAWTQLLGNVGIPTEGLDDVQAAQAIINEMVPA